MVWLLFVEFSWWISVNLHFYGWHIPTISIYFHSHSIPVIYLQSCFLPTDHVFLVISAAREKNMTTARWEDALFSSTRTMLCRQTARFLVSGRAGVAKGLLSLMDLYHIISYHIISYHITSYHIISYHIISYHTISYHIISYLSLFCLPWRNGQSVSIIITWLDITPHIHGADMGLKKHTFPILFFIDLFFFRFIVFPGW